MKSDDSSDSENEINKYITLDGGEVVDRTFIMNDNSAHNIWYEEGGFVELDEFA